MDDCLIENIAGLESLLNAMRRRHTLPDSQLWEQRMACSYATTATDGCRWSKLIRRIIVLACMNLETMRHKLGSSCDTGGKKWPD